MQNQHIKFRVSKTTPTKIGQFVTFYKRNKAGLIIPYDINDPFDKLIISVKSNKKFGQFIFPKLALFENGLLSDKGQGGKRAMRVYPPWIVALNKQAKETQCWQIKYFLEIHQNQTINSSHIQKLFILKL